MKRALVMAGVIASSILAALASATPVAADCGWPSCDPATMSTGGSYYLYITPPNGSRGPLYVNFSSSTSYPSLETWTSTSGSSEADWDGCCPWNPNSDTLIDNWSTAGLAISVSLPPGAGFSGSGSSASYSTNSGAYWKNHHNFSGVQFNAFDIWSITENACSDMQFSYDGEYHCTPNHTVAV